MKKIIILQGPPACGKSTWANEYMEKHSKNTVIISRDAIRHSLGTYDTKHEKEVSKIEKEQIKDAISKHLNIINDATNLNPKTLEKWEAIAKDNGYEVEYMKFYIPFKEAVERDKNADRKHHVGKAVIKSFYLRYFKAEYENEMLKTINYYRMEQNETLPLAVICDLDGTIAWMQKRSPYDLENVDKDLADKSMVTLVNKLMEAGVFVLFTSGREGTPSCKEKTMQWLVDHLDKNSYVRTKMDGTYNMFSLFMRKEKDYRGDEVVKKEIFENEIKPFYNIICAFDDRNKVVNMWREIGLLCCQVNDGDF